MSIYIDVVEKLSNLVEMLWANRVCALELSHSLEI